jgi:hypothetical protein
LEKGIDVLLIKCAGCRRKLWKYEKIGAGEVLRCHKKRIDKIYGCAQEEDRVRCRCGKPIGIDKGSYIKMIGNAFTYSGTKKNLSR